LKGNQAWLESSPIDFDKLPDLKVDENALNSDLRDTK